MKGHILVVDDEAIMRRTLRDLLQLEGYTVDTAPNGREALLAIERGSYDVVILDLKMPGMSGDEVLRRLNLMGADVGVIMLTGHGSLESAIEALRQRAYDYLLKPVQPEALFKSVAQAVKQVRERRRQRLLLEQLEQMLSHLRSEGVTSTGTSLRAVTSVALELPNGVVVDLGRRRLRYGDLEVHLTPTETRLLQVLLEHRDEVMTHQALVEFIHGYQVDPWEAPEILRPIVSRLRRKLSNLPQGRQWIVSVRGTGYMLDWGVLTGEKSSS